MLVDHYHLSLDAIGNLTDRSLHEVYFHPREQDGSIRIPTSVIESPPPEIADTLENTLSSLQMFLDMKVISQEDYDRCVAEAHAKYKDHGPEQESS